MFIRTERLFLRPGWPEDLDELLAVLRDDAVLRNLALAPLPGTAEEAREYLARPRHRLLPNFFIYARSFGGPRLVGGIGLGRDGDDVELGYWIVRAHRGKGYAAEAVRAVLAQARMLGHRQIVARHFADNETSARVLESTGFKPTGETRPRFSTGRGGEAPAMLYVAVLSENSARPDGAGTRARRNPGPEQYLKRA
ncbi:GNAT family N-acetyltransferase [Novosphingobium album (ex Liu et al. 2023)]|uniref:GNAT family N-acetyltransferase n=1 Tax=Novosphingobium album (ex Liu et al. 2023) TaxID=3031130 RepID=A0ABT5WSC7_9SPHN|nr:GNAT family N-acetyltransferase [Novosphingobium album (ex Liu et al. 2023)]MDE8652944.1 GNAT family N-acetyltransferase [Novosphingobium album (ex Liu et al. 2023)]